MKTNDNDFEELRRLLALKRYEVPPPGYFQDFSVQVIACIEAPERAPILPWWERLGVILRPAAVCGFGVVMCSLLVGALIAAQGNESNSQPLLTQIANQGDGFRQYDRQLIPVSLAEVPASVAPVLPGTSPFNQFIPSAGRAKFNVLLAGN
jgi:hypothetical protein